MLKNKKINLSIIKKVSKALGELNEQVAYVGGATVSLYADDPAADDVRPTKDIDIVLHIVSFVELTALQEKLAQKGIHPDLESKIIVALNMKMCLLISCPSKRWGGHPPMCGLNPASKI